MKLPGWLVEDGNRMAAVFFRAALLWVCMGFCAVAAGTLRELLLRPRLGEQAAHVAGTLLVVGLFALILAKATPWVVRPLERKTVLRVAAGWVVATVAFEFGFGHFVAGHSWARLLADYNLLAGRLWVLVLVTIFVVALAVCSFKPRPG